MLSIGLVLMIASRESGNVSAHSPYTSFNGAQAVLSNTVESKLRGDPGSRTGTLGADLYFQAIARSEEHNV